MTGNETPAIQLGLHHLKIVGNHRVTVYCMPLPDSLFQVFPNPEQVWVNNMSVSLFVAHKNKTVQNEVIFK